MNDLELIRLLEEYGYVPSFENLVIFKEDYDCNIELLNEKARLGILANNAGNNLLRKYKVSDITVESLVKDYLNNKNISGRTVNAAFLRSAAREDSRCEEIREKIKEEIANPNQNKHRVDSLRNAYFAALDRLWSKEAKENRDSKNKSYVIKEGILYKTTKYSSFDEHASLFSILCRGSIDKSEAIAGSLVELGAVGVLAAVVILGVNVVNSINSHAKEKILGDIKDPRGYLELIYREANKNKESVSLRNSIKADIAAYNKDKNKELKNKIYEELSSLKKLMKVIKNKVKIDISDDSEHKNIEESFDTNSMELLDEKARLGILANNSGNNLVMKYKMSDISVEELVKDYLNYKNLSGRSVNTTYLRAAARKDSECEEIRKKLKEEIANPNQNKRKVDSLRNEYFEALDRVWTAESKEQRNSKNTKYIIKKM